ncbi:magnesium transporter [Plastorhodobacter daqingensis]|uniref:Magnesium transporter MgtE n=1 Tax=Plastorhodobacter daqingensis TaxID=1387281 RepID=A0ABW2UKL7_9RHOB
MTEPGFDPKLRDDVHIELDRSRIEAILEAVERRDTEALTALLDPLHAADIADLLEQIGPSERRDLLSLWSGHMDGEILSEIDESIREEVIHYLPREVLTEAVRELDSDDVVDILEDLEEPQQEIILGALEDADRVAVEQAMAFPEYSAGRLMQRETVVAPQDWTVGQAIDFLRQEEWLPDQFYHVILVDPRMRPIGHVTLGRLLASKRDVRLQDITEEGFRTIRATEEESEVAYLFNQYHLISAPVVDENDRLVGVITIDDAMNVLDAEHEEDILRFAGVSEESSLADGVVDTVRQRLPWLVVNLFTASLSAVVISFFEDTIAALVALAALMPIVASTGGIGGTQSLAVAVRALATRSLTSANAGRVVRRELLTGLVNGVGLAIILGLAGYLIFGEPMLGVVLGLAMIANQMVAALGGALVPLTLNRLGFDPALASGTFVTTLTDVMGFFAFLGLATVFLI